MGDFGAVPKRLWEILMKGLLSETVKWYEPFKGTLELRLLH